MTIPKAGPDPIPELAAFLEPFAGLVRRAESREALERYATGLLADLPRKTASDLGRALPGTSPQRLQEFLTNTAWDAAAMDKARIALMRERASAGEGIFIVDDTGLPKKGTHSVGVARQYSGTLGRVDNCQVLVTLHYVDRVFDWPVSAQLYLPRPWAENTARRKQVRVPDEIEFQTKGEIALGLIKAADFLPAAVVADGGYGDQPVFLDGLQAKSLPYAVRVASTLTFRAAECVHADPGTDEQPPWKGRGRRPKARTMVDRVPQESAEALLDALPPDAWRTVAWREGSGGALVKSCARRRVFRTGLRGAHVATEGWLFGERPLPGRGGESKYYLAVGSDDLTLESLMERVHVRWVIERFYQDAKGELGLDDYEGRLWTGLHRHVALVMLAHSFLTLRQTYGPELLGDGPDHPPRPDPGRGFPPSGSPQRGRATPRRTRGPVPAGA